MSAAIVSHCVPKLPPGRISFLCRGKDVSIYFFLLSFCDRLLTKHILLCYSSLSLDSEHDSMASRLFLYRNSIVELSVTERP